MFFSVTTSHDTSTLLLPESTASKLIILSGREEELPPVLQSAGSNTYDLPTPLLPEVNPNRVPSVLPRLSRPLPKSSVLPGAPAITLFDPELPFILPIPAT